MNRANCSRVKPSSPSALAKWVKMPSGSSPGRAQTRRMARTLSSSASGRAGKPRRLIPVSALMWTFTRRPAAMAAADRASAPASSKTVTVAPSSTDRGSSPGGTAPRTRMGVPIPARRSWAASSTQATAR